MPSIERLEDLDAAERELVEVARGMRARAYAPYSCFHVGAAVRGASGQVYTGCNVENVSYGATLCAERNAVTTGVAAGESEFATIAVTATSHEPCPPCGMCRQVLAEFNPDMTVLLVSDDGRVARYRLSWLLPSQFHPRFLEGVRGRKKAPGTPGERPIDGTQGPQGSQG